MSSGSLRAATRETGGGRAFWPGPRTAVAAAVIIAVAVVAALAIGLSSGGGRRAASVQKYGHLPSWLPKISNATTRLEVARPASPILSEEQGYTVHAELPQGAANVTAVGPQIPTWVSSAVQSGRWADGRPVPGTFVVTVIDAQGTIQLASGAFTILTDTGQIVHPTVTLVGGGRPPAALHAGQHVNLDVRGAVAEGSGSIRWAPLGPRVLVGWIYQVEFN